MALKINFWILIMILVLLFSLMVVLMVSANYINVDFLSNLHAFNAIELAGEVCGTSCTAGG